MSGDQESKPSFSPGRRWLIIFNVTLSIVALLGLLVMVNYLATGYFKRFHWTSQSRLEISPQTARVVQSITNDVHITIFFDAKGEPELYEWIASLLREYSYLNHRLRLKTIDYTRYPGDAEILLSKYKLTNLKDKNFVIFDGPGGRRVVFANELVDYDVQAVLSGQSKEFRRSGFKGEMLFSSALFSVTYLRPQKAYFAYGHGEHDPKNLTDIYGYGKFAAILKDENNVEWEKFLLQSTNEIPADCHLLILAASRTSFEAGDLEKIEKYLRQGGRMLVLLANPVMGGNSGIDRVLNEWGVIVGNQIVVESPEYSPSRNDLLTAKLNPEHPILKPMVAENLQIYLVLPRAVGPRGGTPGGAESRKVDILAATSNEASEQSAPGNDVTGGARRKGSFPLIAAVEQGTIKGVSTGARIVAVGDSLCFDNQLINNAANSQFVHRAIDWLLDRPAVLLAGLGPRPVQEYTLRMPRSQMKKVQWILLGGLPGAILLVGFLVWLQRRT